MTEPEQLQTLQAENARLVALLERHGIEWRVEPPPALKEAPPPLPTMRLATSEKVALFRRLFRGRTDVFPVRWESKTSGKTGYAPACANEWRAGVCEKPRIKCSDCGHRELVPMSDAVIYEHLSGKKTVGVYPLLADDTCNFLAVDFDEADWRDDATAFIQACRELRVPAALEISRSGNGAHAWIFFSHPVAARDARRLGTAIISHTCAKTRQLKLSSYDRLFPNQDSMPKGGFGNLIALPLQKGPRETGFSVFVDETLQAYPDQWAYLASLGTMSGEELESVVRGVTGGAHPLDVTFVDDEDLREPWRPARPVSSKLPGPMPDRVDVTLANLVYFEKSQLPPPLSNRLIRLAAFQNPEFYRAQAMRMSVWDKPRVVGCAENFPRHIALPRGCLDAARDLLRQNGVRCLLRDERTTGRPIDLHFVGSLRNDQIAAVDAMLAHDFGVLCAPTAFGKTVVAAALIARRQVNTLVLVHRTELLKQWQARLGSFLDAGKGSIGVIGGGRSKPTGIIDIGVMQSLSRQGDVDPIVENYGHVIIDECHHVGAFSFEAILKKVKAANVVGLTATPIRRDGQQPIIFMQCGPIRHTAALPEDAPTELIVEPHYGHAALRDAAIQDVFRDLAADQNRTNAIANAALDSYGQGRKVLVLTERKDHLDAIAEALHGRADNLFALHGRMTKKERNAVLAALDQLPAPASRILLATGKLVGEGFDHAPLDTMILAMPVSWKGTLQQYAGRLHRSHSEKTDVRIVDFVDTGNAALTRMWEKRQRGYRTMGYKVNQPRSPVLI